MRVGRQSAAASLGAVLLAAGAMGFGCGGGGESGVGGAKLPSGTESVEHEACSESGNRVEVLDANGDGKPDIKRVYNSGTGKETCRITDLNHDGKPDLFEYFDSNGQIRRREADYDDNGVVDAVEYYENGKLVRREYDTTGQHRIDTWDFFDPATGKRVRRERDTTNDGRVDQWWAYEGNKVTIAVDKNGDGKPDPADTIVLGGELDGGTLGSTPPPPAPSAPVAPSVASDAGPPSAGDAQAPSTTRTPPADAGADGGAKRKEKR